MSDWEAYLVNCNNNQVQGVYDKEKDRMNRYAEFVDQPTGNDG